MAESESGEDLHSVLTRLGLEQYYGTLVDNGFESWNVVLDIAESDFDALGFKLGHRRVLQREIASFLARRQSPDASRPVLSTSSAAVSPSRSSSSTTSVSISGSSVGAAAGGASSSSESRRKPADEKRDKRRYRRHPKQDPNAPKRPKTAYVGFFLSTSAIDGGPVLAFLLCPTKLILPLYHSLLHLQTGK